MKQILTLLPILLMGCTSTEVVRAPNSNQTQIDAPTVTTTCHIESNDYKSTMLNCRFHNDTVSTANSCVQVAFVANFEHDVQYLTAPICSGVLGHGDSANSSIIISSLTHTHLSHACGRDLDHCTLKVEPAKPERF